MTNHFVEIALPLARRGWSVIPVRLTIDAATGDCEKRPLLSRWKPYQSELADAVQIDDWDACWSDAAVGVVTGCLSRLAVLDTDSPQGEAAAIELGVPPTPMVRTPRGLHRYYRAPNFRCAGWQGKVTDIDFRCDGNFVVGAGSVRPDGRKYEWLVTPEECPLAQVPRWVISSRALSAAACTSIAASTPETPAIRTGAGAGWARMQPRRIPDGHRGTELFKYACRLRGPHALDFDAILAALRKMNTICDPQKSDDVLRRIAVSACRYPKGSVPRRFY